MPIDLVKIDSINAEIDSNCSSVLFQRVANVLFFNEFC